MEQEMEALLQSMMCQTTKIGSDDTEICPKCKGTGYYMKEMEDGYEYAFECDCGLIQKRLQNSLLSFANIPETFKKNTIVNFDCSLYKDKSAMEEKVKVVRYYVENFEQMKEKGMGLYFFSKTKGSGKTRLCTSIANELIDKGIQVKFATSIDIINAIKKTWDSKEPQADKESDLLKALQDTEVLIIDDFGTERVKDWISERWYSIINTRYVDKKPTLFTSNMALNDLKYDERITNRIKERTYQIVFPEESIRDFLSKQNNKNLRGEMYGTRQKSNRTQYC